MLKAIPCPQHDCDGILEARTSLWLDCAADGTVWPYGVSDILQVSCKDCGDEVPLDHPALESAYRPLRELSERIEKTIRAAWPIPTYGTNGQWVW